MKAGKINGLGQELIKIFDTTDWCKGVSVMKAGGEKAIKAFNNMSLTQGDTIITGKNSKATLLIDDDITLYVAENTRIDLVNIT